MDPKLWTDLIHPDISIAEKMIRPVLVYLFLVISLRLAGKRELMELGLRHARRDRDAERRQGAQLATGHRIGVDA